MASQRIATGESSTTFVTSVRPFTRVKFSMALEIVQSPEPRLTGLANVWFLLAVRQQVTLQVVVARKVCRAVWTLVSLIGSW